MSSKMARRVKMTTAAVDPMKASGVPSRCSQPRCAAHATAAGAVSARKPAMTPIANARRRTMDGLMRQNIASWALGCQQGKQATISIQGQNLAVYAFPGSDLFFLVKGG